MCGRSEVVPVLIQNGVNVNAMNNEVCSQSPTFKLRLISLCPFKICLLTICPTLTPHVSPVSKLVKLCAVSLHRTSSGRLVRWEHRYARLLLPASVASCVRMPLHPMIYHSCSSCAPAPAVACSSTWERATIRTKTSKHITIKLFQDLIPLVQHHLVDEQWEAITKDFTIGNWRREWNCWARTRHSLTGYQ